MQRYSINSSFDAEKTIFDDVKKNQRYVVIQS